MYTLGRFSPTTSEPFLPRVLQESYKNSSKPSQECCGRFLQGSVHAQQSVPIVCCRDHTPRRERIWSLSPHFLGLYVELETKFHIKRKQSTIQTTPNGRELYVKLERNFAVPRHVHAYVNLIGSLNSQTKK